MDFIFSVYYFVKLLLNFPRNWWWCGQMITLSMEPVAVGFVVHGIDLAIITRIGIGALNIQGATRPRALEVTFFIAFNTVTSFKAVKREIERIRRLFSRKLKIPMKFQNPSNSRLIIILIKFPKLF